MIKKQFIALAVVGALSSALIGCGVNNSAPASDELNVVLVTDAASIDDKSFNQGTWEGVQRYANDHEDVKNSYLVPSEASTQAFMNSIDNAVLSGAEVVITPGFVFEEAIGIAQAQYPDVKFVFIDGQPTVDGEYIEAKNVQSIFFKEQEASFLTGVATALQSKTGKVGFIGGVKVPAVEKLGYGFVSGMAYANKTLGTNVEVIDYVYSGSFTDVQAGQMLASGMYDKGADVVLQAAGGVGVGAIGEAKTRTEAGDKVYIVGVDVDQYESGLMSNGSSVILTSAMKKLDEAVYQALSDIQNNEFKGGTTSVLGISENGVGLPTENPNLEANVLETVESVKELIEAGEIVVPATLEETKTFLNEKGMNSGFLNE